MWWLILCVNLRRPRYAQRVFLDEIYIWISRLSKTDCPPQCPSVGGPHLIHWRLEYRKRLSKKELFLCLQGGTSVFSCLQTPSWTGTFTTGSPGAGFLNLHNHIRQFLVINNKSLSFSLSLSLLCTHAGTYPTGYISLEYPNTQMNWKIKCPT